MSVYRTDTNEVWDEDGELVSSEQVQTDITEEANQSSIETNLEQDMLAMQAILDATNATINSNPAPHIKNIARMLKRLGRTALKDYSGTD